jgi:hypothetical protein
MKLPQFVLAFIVTICLIFAGNTLAQTDINLNNLIDGQKSVRIRVRADEE